MASFIIQNESLKKSDNFFIKPFFDYGYLSKISSIDTLPVKVNTDVLSERSALKILYFDGSEFFQRDPSSGYLKNIRVAPEKMEKLKGYFQHIKDKTEQIVNYDEAQFIYEATGCDLRGKEKLCFSKDSRSHSDALYLDFKRGVDFFGLKKNDFLESKGKGNEDFLRELKGILSPQNYQLLLAHYSQGPMLFMASPWASILQKTSNFVVVEPHKKNRRIKLLEREGNIYLEMQVSRFPLYWISGNEKVTDIDSGHLSAQFKLTPQGFEFDYLKTNSLLVLEAYQKDLGPEKIHLDIRLYKKFSKQIKIVNEFLNRENKDEHLSLKDLKREERIKTRQRKLKSIIYEDFSSNLKNLEEELKKGPYQDEQALSQDPMALLFKLWAENCLKEAKKFNWYFSHPSLVARQDIRSAHLLALSLGLLKEPQQSKMQKEFLQTVLKENNIGTSLLGKPLLNFYNCFKKIQKDKNILPQAFGPSFSSFAERAHKKKNDYYIYCLSRVLDYAMLGLFVFSALSWSLTPLALGIACLLTSDYLCKQKKTEENDIFKRKKSVYSQRFFTSSLNREQHQEEPRLRRAAHA